MDRRRFLLTSLVGALAAPLAAGAQPAGKVYRIAVIASGAPPTPAGPDPLFERLGELGWVYGRDVVAERRAYGDRMDRVTDIAAELIRTGPVDVFVVEGSTDAGRVQQVTREIPIVASRAGGLVDAGLAASLARPGGNVTGIQTLQPQLAAKHLSLLKEAIPAADIVDKILRGAKASEIPVQQATKFRLIINLKTAKAAGLAIPHTLLVRSDELIE